MNRDATKMLEFKSERRAKWEKLWNNKILEHPASNSFDLGKVTLLLR